jgi:release factor glutamine methyltransferase
MYTVKAALEEATLAIGRVDANVLMAHSLGVDRAHLIANPMRVLTEGEDARIDMLVAKRAMGYPVAYLLGTREFWSREFRVTPDVLIPRPETETLVEAALARCQPGQGRDSISVLDLGTGSGAIAITLALEAPAARVTATDASAASLEIARANAQALGARIEWAQGGWYSAVPGRTFDLIVSNPPYIAAQDPHLAEGDLRFEPPAALCDGSADGLDSIRAIVGGARSHLSPGGWLLLEHGHDQAEAVARILRDAEFAEPISIPDLAGIPRVAGATLNA